MKKILAVSLVLFLSACLQIQDFGAYWEKAALDPGLAGRWRPVSSNAAGISFDAKSVDNAYLVTNSEDDKFLSIRTYRVGDYDLLFIHNHRSILRYKLQGKTLKIYFLNVIAARELAKKSYPQIYKTVEANHGPYEFVLNDQLLKFISAVPDTENYWELRNQLEKVE